MFEITHLDVNRRNFFQQQGINLGVMALGMLLQNSARGEVNRTRVPETSTSDPLQAHPAHSFAKAKHVIYLHMIGAPSQLDLFDYKPYLNEHHGEICPEEFSKGKKFAFIGKELRLAGTPFKFKQHGEAGHSISELLPHLSQIADELTFIKSVHSEEINHAPAQMFLHTGFGRGGRPSFGSWVTYGLGSENQDLPAYVVLLSGPLAGAGTSLWSTGFLPSIYQGVQFRSTGDPVLFLTNPEGHTAQDRRRVLDTLAELNQQQYAEAHDPEIITRISQYQMSYKMQTSVPDLMDLSEESHATLKMYGAEPGKASFSNNCLLARRLVERGVRVIQLFDADWDHHSNLRERIKEKTRDVDQGIAALIKDLKQRGLLDDTLIVWGSEFGRTPIQQGIDGSGNKTNAGRDHNKDCFTMFMAGGGIKSGISFGTSDELGFGTGENPVHVHDINATILHLLGLNHEKLTYKYQGREFRLTDVHGNILHDILA